MSYTVNEDMKFTCVWSNVNEDMSGMIGGQIRQSAEIYMSLVNCQ